MERLERNIVGAKGMRQLLRQLADRGVLHLICIGIRILSIYNIRGRTSRGACDEGNSRL